LGIAVAALNFGERGGAGAASVSLKFSSVTTNRAKHTQGLDAGMALTSSLFVMIPVCSAST
jgi:hypothetical protein